MTQIQRQITILLDDAAAARLREVARQRGETLEHTAHVLLLAALSAATATSAGTLSATSLPGLPRDDPDGSKAILALLGTVHYPDVSGKVNTTNAEMDRLIAEEAMNPHGDKR